MTSDTVAERLRRQTRNLLGSPRVSSNLTGVVDFVFIILAHFLSPIMIVFVQSCLFDGCEPDFWFILQQPTLVM